MLSFLRTSRELKQEVATSVGMVGGIMGHEGQRLVLHVLGKI
jgi:hypothetical protein